MPEQTGVGSTQSPPNQAMPKTHREVQALQATLVWRMQGVLLSKTAAGHGETLCPGYRALFECHISLSSAAGCLCPLPAACTKGQVPHHSVTGSGAGASHPELRKNVLLR